MSLVNTKLHDYSYHNKKNNSWKLTKNVLCFSPKEIRSPSIMLSVYNITDAISMGASIIINIAIKKGLLSYLIIIYYYHLRGCY